MKLYMRFLAVVVLVSVLSVPGLAEEVRLTLLTHYSTAHPHGRALEEYAAEYERLNPGVKIEIQFITNDMMLNRLVVGAASDTLPDMAHVAGYMLADSPRQGHRSAARRACRAHSGRLPSRRGRSTGLRRQSLGISNRIHAPGRRVQPQPL